MVNPFLVEDGDKRQRALIMHSTIEYLNAHEIECGHLSLSNLLRWALMSSELKTDHAGSCRVLLVGDDMLETAGKLTKEYGQRFAVLNMANATHPGGGFATGAAAQEENMVRRTNLVNAFSSDVLRWKHDGRVTYTTRMTNLINAKDGRVYCDDPRKGAFRVCVRGPEDYSKSDLGYEFLPAKQIFSFYELRSAALNLQNRPFEKQDEATKKAIVDETKKRIRAQFVTLIDKGIRHVVLSAFGCGAFYNCPKIVSTLYASAIHEFRNSFDVICFAIFYAGHGENNAYIFHKTFKTTGVDFESYANGYPTSSRV